MYLVKDKFSIFFTFESVFHFPPHSLVSSSDSIYQSSQKIFPTRMLGAHLLGCVLYPKGKERSELWTWLTHVYVECKPKKSQATEWMDGLLQSIELKYVCQMSGGGISGGLALRTQIPPLIELPLSYCSTCSRLLRRSTTLLLSTSRRDFGNSFQHRTMTFELLLNPLEIRLK